MLRNHDLFMTLTFDLNLSCGGILSEFYSKFLPCYRLDETVQTEV